MEQLHELLKKRLHLSEYIKLYELMSEQISIYHPVMVAEQGRILPVGYRCEEVDGTLILYKPALACTSVKVIKERSAE